MSNSRFSIVQAGAAGDERLSDAQLRTLVALGCYSDKNGWCFPSLRTIGKKLHKSAQAVSRDIQHLVKLGYLDKQRRFDENGSKKSNLYRLKFDTLSTSEVGTLSTPEVDTLSTSEVDTLSTPEVDITSHINDPINDDSLSRPNFRKLTLRQALQLPTLRIYQAATDFFPGAAAWEYVHDTIRRHQLTAEKIRPFFSEWVARGYNPENIKGILDVVVNGWREKERPRSNPTDPYRSRDDRNREVISRLAEGMLKNEPFSS